MYEFDKSWRAVILANEAVKVFTLSFSWLSARNEFGLVRDPCHCVSCLISDIRLSLKNA